MASRRIAFFFRLFITCLLGSLLIACGKSSPEGTVKDYLDAVANNRVEEAVAFYTLKNVKENDLTMAKGKLQMIIGEQYSKIQTAGGLQSVETKIIRQENDKATVEAHIVYSDSKEDTARFNLVKEDGGWKIQMK
jgi:hypothetical protein